MESETVDNTIVRRQFSQRDKYVNSLTQENNDLDVFPLPQIIYTFRGRKEKIQQLNDLFIEQKCAKVVISGPSGIGKTELAKQFANIYLHKEFDRIFWIPSENEQELSNRSSRLKKIYRKCKEKRCLFIFDYVICRHSIFKYEPPANGNYFLLITSQQEDWGADVIPLKLDSMSPKSAIELFESVLCKKFNKHETDLYEKLGEMVEYIPLSLQIIAGCIQKEIFTHRENFCLEEYVERVNKSQNDIEDENFFNSSTNNNKSIYAAMKISLDKMKNINENDYIIFRNLVINVLFICSYLNPEFIFLEELLLLPNIKDLLKKFHSSAKYMLRLSLYKVDNFLLLDSVSTRNPIIINKQTQSLLRYYLKTCDQVKQIEIYKLCLQYILEEATYNYNMYNIESVLKYADENRTTVHEFYNHHKQNKNIIVNLIKYDCIQCLKKIVETCTGCTKKEFIYKNDLLHLAAKYGQTKILRLLLDDIDINERNAQNETILHTAAREWDIKQIDVLFELKPNVTARNNAGNVPLFEFVNRPHYSTSINWSDILTKFQFDRGSINNNKETLLHVAAANYNDTLVKLLINGYEMNVEQIDAQGRTPLDVLQDTFSTSTFYNHEINRGMATAKLLL